MPALPRHPRHIGSQFQTLPMRVQREWRVVWRVHGCPSLATYDGLTQDGVSLPSPQICRFCWHHIKENLNGRCPACRKPYDDAAIEFKPMKPEE